MSKIINEDLEDVEAIEKMQGNIVENIERVLSQLGESLPEQVDGLSQKQLRRALKATINYVYKKEDDTVTDSLSDREKKFIGGMITLVEAGTQYSMHIISELHQQQLEQQAKEKDNA
jgi:hypothetical protein